MLDKVVEHSWVILSPPILAKKLNALHHEVMFSLFDLVVLSVPDRNRQRVFKDEIGNMCREVHKAVLNAVTSSEECFYGVSGPGWKRRDILALLIILKYGVNDKFDSVSTVTPEPLSDFGVVSLMSKLHDVARLVFSGDDRLFMAQAKSKVSHAISRHINRAPGGLVIF